MNDEEILAPQNLLILKQELQVENNCSKIDSCKLEILFLFFFFIHVHQSKYCMAGGFGLVLILVIMIWQKGTCTHVYEKKNLPFSILADTEWNLVVMSKSEYFAEFILMFSDKHTKN